MKSFKKSHDLQTLTLELQALQKEVEELELLYLSKTNLHNVFEVASKELGMVRQSRRRVFSNREIQAR